MSQAFFTTKTITVPAGATRSAKVTGVYFYCLDAAAPFDYGFNESELWPGQLGMGRRLLQGEYFTEIFFRNPSLTDSVTIKFDVGSGELIDNRLNIVPDRAGQPDFGTAPTLIRGAGVDSLAGSAHLHFAGTGATGSGYGLRKSLLVTNLDPSLNLEIWTDETTPVRVATAFFQQVLQLDTTADLTVRNENATPIACRISEIFLREGL